jgi:uncharacterized membrane protein HdeD (DUF308 family)
MAARLSRNWWTQVVRGVFAILFGLAAFVWPEETLAVLVMLVAVYILVDGLLALTVAFLGHEHGARWWSFFLEGVVGVAAGILGFAWPEVTAVFLIILVAAWAIVTGVIELNAAFGLRRHIRGEFWLALSGFVSVLFGLIVLFWPREAVWGIVWLIGGYAIIFGVTLVSLGLRLRRRYHQQTHHPAGA